jgi:glycopeptide antibiotics resistance protein
MWKSILITPVTLSVAIAALSFPALGLTKLLGMEHFPLVIITMTLVSFRAVEDLSPLVKTIHMLMPFGSGGQLFIHGSNTLE